MENVLYVHEMMPFHLINKLPQTVDEVFSITTETQIQAHINTHTHAHTATKLITSGHTQKRNTEHSRN